MTAGECYQRIQVLNSRYDEILAEIKDTNHQQEELTQLIFQLRSTADHFEAVRCSKLTRVDAAMADRNKISKRYVAGMTDLLSGRQYQSVRDGLDRSIDSTKRKIEERNQHLERLAVSRSQILDQLDVMHRQLAVALAAEEGE